MRILFIGNSYTHFNAMPDIFAELCVSRGKRVEVESVAADGYTLDGFLQPNDAFALSVAKKLSDKRYDAIVLQEHSVRPVNEPELFFDSCRRLAEMADRNGASLLLYQTWARRDCHPTLERLDMTHEQMQSALRSSYEQAAERFGAKVVYAGDAMHRAYRGFIGDAVYDDDGTHPSPLGSRIIAETFYEAIFG